MCFHKEVNHSFFQKLFKKKNNKKNHFLSSKDRFIFFFFLLRHFQYVCRNSKNAIFYEENNLSLPDSIFLRVIICVFLTLGPNVFVVCTVRLCRKKNRYLLNPFFSFFSNPIAYVKTKHIPNHS